MNYFQRLQKAIMLDVSFYEEVENDKKFTDQAMMTVVLCFNCTRTYDCWFCSNCFGSRHTW